MDTQNALIALLEQFPQAVFLAKDGIIVYANHGARIRDVQVNTKIYDLITIGLPEYRQFSAGKLMLTVSVAGILYNTVVTRSGEYHLFCLESEYARPEFKAYAAAAQYFRNPLANAEFNIDQLLPDPSVQASASAVAQIKALKKNLYQINRAVRNMSDAATISKETPTESRNVTSVIAELIENVNAKMAPIGRHIDFQPLENGCFCQINRENLERAILNLISNAAKYSADNSNIQVSMRLSANTLYISVEGTSDNCSNVLGSNLFSGFTREPSLDSGSMGIGLGLTIVHGIATAHKGTLLVDQPNESRLRFTISISVQTPSVFTVNSPKLHIDRAGGMDTVLLELSDILPAELY